MDDQKAISINITRKTLMNIVVLGLIVWAVLYLKNLLFVVLTSIVLASFIRIAAEKLKKTIGLSRVLSVVLMYLLTFAVLGAIFYFFIPILIVETSHLLPLISKYLPAGLPWFDMTGFANADVSSITNIKSFLSVVSSGLGSTLAGFFGGLINVALVAIISFYLSVSTDGIESFLRIVAPVSREEYIIDLWNRSQKKIALWAQGQLLLGVVVGVLTFIGLVFLNVPHALLLGLVAALFELIPFGIFLAAIPAISLGFASGGITLALMVVALYIIIQQLESYLIAPLVVHKVTGVSPLVVILSVLIGVTLAGFWGLILAVPVAVTILEYISDLEKERLRTKSNE
jgi:predicted PurR-regulated permease PerM